MTGEQRWDAETYARNARFVADLGAAALDLLAPKRDERILDLGCGDGALTERIVATGACVVGGDTSQELIAAARARGLDARLIDGQHLTFVDEFDAVFTNAALHWMRDTNAVLAGVFRALWPGGRFVGEFGGHGNVAAICTALIAVLDARGVDGAARFPWYFPTPTAVARLLERHGFAVETIASFPRPTPLPTGMRGWLETFANPLLGGFETNERSRVLDSVTAALAPSLCDDEGRWTADYVRLRFAAHRP